MLTNTIHSFFSGKRNGLETERFNVTINLVNWMEIIHNQYEIDCSTIHGIAFTLPIIDHYLCMILVSKTNLSVHEDKNRVPFVKVCRNHCSLLNSEY